MAVLKGVSGKVGIGANTVAEITDRSERITAWLRHTHHIDALVVACNTATALAIDSLRATHPDLPIVGVEPALKPAAATSHTRHIGVLATRGTLNSERFARCTVSRSTIRISRRSRAAIKAALVRS